MIVGWVPTVVGVALVVRPAAENSRDSMENDMKKSHRIAVIAGDGIGTG
jgi:hypothetical protein